MSNNPTCLHCGVTSQQVPLITLSYQGSLIHICAQHLPLLIHEPSKLASSLPEAVNWPKKVGH